MEKINTLINELETLKPDLFGKDFLLTWDNSLDSLKVKSTQKMESRCLPMFLRR